MKKIILIMVLCLALVTNASAKQGENITIKIAVMGPGDALYFWWGHIALIIEDSITGRSYLYDYGQFSFDQENFYFNFAMGKLYYSCGVSYAENGLAYYILTNRDLTVYTLDLPEQKRVEILNFAQTNVLPENRNYNYHHFKDNCSTRIRDIVDLITDGQFSDRYKNAPGRYTLREHVRRHTWFNSLSDWALNFWMGQGIDTQITIWEEMFLPSEVAKRISEFYYTDSEGQERKLVKSAAVLSRAKDRPEVLDVPRKQWPRQLVFSLALSFVFGFFFFLKHKNKKTGVVLAGLSMGFCSLFFGVAGLLLYFMSLVTNHDYTFYNMNMIFCSPVLLAGFPLGFMYAFTKKKEKRSIYELLLRLIWLLTVIGIFITMILKLFPPFWQKNLTDQMLMLPIALVFALQPWGLRDSWEKLKIRKGR